MMGTNKTAKPQAWTERAAEKSGGLQNRFVCGRSRVTSVLSRTQRTKLKFGYLAIVLIGGDLSWKHSSLSAKLRQTIPLLLALRCHA
jgi:hypothetical protein